MRDMTSRWTVIAIIIAGTSALLGVSGAALAQGAKQACAGDIQKYCAGIEQGEGRIAKCLREHKTQLTPGCSEGMQAATKQMKEVVMACEDDVHQYCAGAAPGTTKDCLKTNFRKLSRGCKRELFEARKSK